MTRARAWLPSIVITASLLSRLAGAADLQEKRINLVPLGGWTYYDRELRNASRPVVLQSGPYLGGRLGVRLVSPLWLDLAGGHTRSADLARVARWTHLSASLLVVSSQPRVVAPFLSLGLGRSKVVPPWSADARDLTFEAAGGLKVKVTPGIGLRFEVRNVLFVPRQDYAKAHVDNVVTGAGLVIAFGGRSRDSDRDGVPDRVDRCPDTPSGCRADAFGCMIDSDGDGLCDGLDMCVDTPRGATVDSRGCPTDADGDGVWDGVDQCARTPRGCVVDARGCPLDADGDGVCDGMDKCPDTPRGCRVDATGCPVDSDGDGVCDGIDRCPDTPSGRSVYSNGCPPSEVRQRETELLDTGLIRLHDLRFVTGSAVLLPSHHSLDVVGEVLGGWPQLQIEIGGHSDSRGGNAYNLALSRRRVESVRAYLLQRFPKLAAMQLLAKGYGASQPLVPNTSPANMARNNRIEFKVLNREVLRSIQH